jgi:hypothetical protein
MDVRPKNYLYTSRPQPPPPPPPPPTAHERREHMRLPQTTRQGWLGRESSTTADLAQFLPRPVDKITQLAILYIALGKRQIRNGFLRKRRGRNTGTPPSADLLETPAPTPPTLPTRQVVSRDKRWSPASRRGKERCLR